MCSIFRVSSASCSFVVRISSRRSDVGSRAGGGRVRFRDGDEENNRQSLSRPHISRSNDFTSAYSTEDSRFSVISSDCSISPASR